MRELVWQQYLMFFWIIFVTYKAIKPELKSFWKQFTSLFERHDYEKARDEFWDAPQHVNCRSWITPIHKKKWREKRMNFRNGDLVLYESNFGFVKATVVGFKNDTDVLIQLKNPQDIVKLVHWRALCKIKRVVK